MSTGHTERSVRGRPRILDASLAVAVLGYESMYIAAHSFDRDLGWTAGAAFAVAVAVCALSLVRRVRPLTVFAGTALAAWAQTLFGLWLDPGCLVLLGTALFTLASRYGWKATAPATGAVGLWVVAASAPLVQMERIRIGEVGLFVLAAVCVAVVGAVVRERRARLEGLRERARRLERERDARARVAAAEERARIAREIHDIVSHGLGTMVVMADGAARVSEVEPRQAGRAMVRVRDTGREAMAEMRRMLDVLRDGDPSERAPQPGLGRLGRLVEELRSTGMRVDVEADGVPVELPPGLDLAAYRIVQEALTNARRHGGPLMSLVTVAVSHEEETVRLRITDDGQGCGPSRREQADGHGLVGMRERAAAYGGTLRAGPRPGGGFEVEAALPVGGNG